MKKRFLIILSIFLFSISLYAQDTHEPKKHGKIGFTYASYGQNDVFRDEKVAGAPSYKGDDFYTLGITYIHPLLNSIDLEMGMEYSKHTILVSPNLPSGSVGAPQRAEFSLINIPVALRVNLFKYFFVNAGVFLDIDRMSDGPIESQKGIGGLIGVGLKYDFDVGVSVFVNPYAKLHSLFQFSPIDNHQQIRESGVRVGLTYDLGGRKVKYEIAK